MKANLHILKDFYSPLHKKWLKANSAIEIDIDDQGQPLHSFWFTQLKDSPEFFKLASSDVKAEVKTDSKTPKNKSE